MAGEKKLSHNDEPVFEDAFGHDDFIKQICRVITDCEPPKGIAVNGYWGTGKTSVLLQIFHQLSGKTPYDLTRTVQKTDLKDNDVFPIWFEAWRYQHEQLPVVALLNEIREQISLDKKVIEEIKKLGSVALLGSLSAFDEAIKAASGGIVKTQLSNIQGTGEKWEADRHLNPLPGQTINKLLETAIKHLLNSSGDKNKRIVIFIDDLDRCSPQTALRLLEGIKVYLNLKNCVVVCGMDQRQIERALKKELELDEKAESSRTLHGREYLEKICQDIYHIPLPNQGKKTEYFINLLNQLDIGDTNENNVHIDSLKSQLNKFDCLPANPRKIKALVNRMAYLLSAVKFKDSIEKEKDQERKRRFYLLAISLTVIYCFHRRVYEQLQKNPLYINTVLQWAKSPVAVKTEEINSFTPFCGTQPLREYESEGKLSSDLPVNPSDSNVFRLHDLFDSMTSVDVLELKPFLTR